MTDQPDLRTLREAAKWALGQNGPVNFCKPAVVLALLDRLDAAEGEWPPLFVKQDFTSHSGLPLHWKIECDALTAADWEALAQIASEVLPPFGFVHGVPTGGTPFAEALRAHTDPFSQLIVVADDVLTTGRSMEEARANWPPALTYGVVAFSRAAEVPEWITPLFQLAGGKAERDEWKAKAETAEAELAKLGMVGEEHNPWTCPRCTTWRAQYDAEVEMHVATATERDAALDRARIAR